MSGLSLSGSAEKTCLLEMRHITKKFGMVKAVDNISLRLKAGEVLSLCGENGSGKSTLMKVLCGIYPFGTFDGEIYFSGEKLREKGFAKTKKKEMATTLRKLRWLKKISYLRTCF